jgi:hypothetical protein
MLPKHLLACGLLLSCLITAGCESKSPTTTVENSSTEPKGSSKSKSPSSDPVAYLTGLQQHIVNGEIHAVWDAFPASYQKDINDLVRFGATKISSEVWNPSFEIIKRLKAIADSKQEFILDMVKENPYLTNSADQKIATETITNILGAFAASTYAKHEQLKSFQGEKFFAETVTPTFKSVSKLKEQLGASEDAGMNPVTTFLTNIDSTRFANEKYTLVSQTDDHARIMVTNPTTKSENEKIFVNVEGKWVPKDIQENWAEGIAQVRQQIETITPEIFETNRKSMVPIFGMINTAIENMEKAETPDQFQAATLSSISTISLLMMQMKPNPQPSATDPSTVPPSTLPSPEITPAIPKPVTTPIEGESKK